MKFDSHRPCNTLSALPPAVDLESRTVLKACINARAAVAELKAAGRLIPNQGVLIDTIPLLEAQASSEIENIVTTTGQAIKGVDMDIRRTPGTTLTNDRTREVIYTPPEGEALLREKLSNWEQWMHGALPGSDTVDPLVRMAVGHYQFETIHPFTDGNGRTGRVVHLLYLVEQGLLDIPVPYLSRHILRRRNDDHGGLQSVTVDLVEAGLAKRQTASLYPKQLTDMGVLEEHKVGREKIFLNPAFLRLLKQD